MSSNQRCRQAAKGNENNGPHDFLSIDIPDATYHSSYHAVRALIGPEFAPPPPKKQSTMAMEGADGVVLKVDPQTNAWVDAYVLPLQNYMTQDEFRTIVADLNAIPQVSSTSAHAVIMLFAIFFFLDMISLPTVIIMYGMDNLISIALLGLSLLVAPSLLIWAVVAYRNRLDSYDSAIAQYLEQVNDNHAARGVVWGYLPSATRAKRQIHIALGNQQPGVVFAAMPAPQQHHLVPVQMYAMPTAEVEMQVLLPPPSSEHQPLIMI